MKDSSGQQECSSDHVIGFAISSDYRICGHADGRRLLLANARLPLKLTFANKEFYSIDFSEVHFDGAIFVGCSFSGCTFSRSNLSNCRFFERCVFSDCRFVHCDMTSIGMKAPEFVACNFENADLRGTFLGEAAFVKCRLLKCRIRNTRFNAQKIDNLEIEGTLVEVVFEGESFADKPKIDLRRAKFNGVSFVNCDTPLVRIPIGSDVVYIDNLGARATNALKALAAIKDVEARKMLARRLRQYVGHTNGIFDRKYLEKYDQGAAFWAEFFSLLDAPDRLQQ